MLEQPGVPADVVMEGLAERLGLLGEVEPPVDMRLLASLQSVGEIAEKVSAHAGCLINDGGRLRIEVNALDRPERQNFTIGHEVCHTLLPGFTLTTNFRCNPGGSRPRASETLNVEWLADVGASELLLPRRFVQGRFDSEGFGWDAIEHVAAVYGASLEATARRRVRLSDRPAAFVNLQFGISRTNPEPELRVRSASWAHMPDVFIPKNKSIPRAHPIFRAIDGEYIHEVADLDALTRRPGGYEIAARPYPYLNSEGETVMRVLVLARKALPDPSPCNEQPEERNASEQRRRCHWCTDPRDARGEGPVPDRACHQCWGE